MVISGGRKGLESTVVGKDCILNGVVRGGLPEEVIFHKNSDGAEGTVWLSEGRTFYAQKQQVWRS